MSIAEQMGRVLQRTAISTNIKVIIFFQNYEAYFILHQNKLKIFNSVVLYTLHLIQSLWNLI